MVQEHLTSTYLYPYDPGTIAKRLYLLHEKFLETGTRNWRLFVPYHVSRGNSLKD